MLEDLGSKNGTFRGNEPVTKPVLLEDGDVIRLGSVLFTFRLAQTAASTEPVRGERRPPNADR
jgi:pSer/pThr/pTyr-binding forkhead associated (FHA) protein